MSSHRGSVPTLSVVFALLAPVSAQVLVKDVRPGSSNSSGLAPNMTAFAAANGFCFTARNSLVAPSGDQLLRWEGVAASPTLLWSAPGSVSIPTVAAVTQLANGDVLFAAGTGSGYGTEWHRTDGTAAGTSVVLDLMPGNGSGFVSLLGTYGSLVMFAGNDGIHGIELWATDGTATGTRMVADISPGIATTNLRAGVEFQGRFYFAADDGVHGIELWVTDGTAAGTQLFYEVAVVGSGLIGNLTVLASTLLFTGRRVQQGAELYASDGTQAGTDILVDLAPGPASALPEELTVLGSACYFRANNGTTGIELWQTDGSTVSLVTDIRPGVASSTPQDLRIVGGALLFTADDGTHGRELWRSDGTAGGTALVADLNVGTGSTFATGLVGVALGTRFVFNADVGGGLGTEPYVTDGTAGGTMLLADIHPGSSSSPAGYTAFQGAVYFCALEPTVGRELWVSDGTPAGTTLALDVSPARPLGGDISLLTRIGDRAVFRADDGVSGQELWVSDGTPAGTSLVDLQPGAFGSSPRDFTSFGGKLLFSANGPSGRELYATDGTAGGTTLVKDIQPGSGSSNPLHFTAWHGELYFTAVDSGRHLWKTDGTASGTLQVSAIDLFDSGDTPIIPLDSQMLLLAFNELYRSDGTAAGTVLVDPVDGVAVNYNAPTLGIGDVGYFFGNRAGLFDLFRSDGTAAGTQHVYQFDYSTITFVGGSYQLFEFDSRLLVQARHTFPGGLAGYGRELFVSDGTTAGTTVLKDIAPFPAADSSPRGLVRANDRLLFSASDQVSGRELWISDGTTAGTDRVADLAPGLPAGVNGAIAAAGVGRRVVFAARDPVAGQELWVSDGTPAGTHRLFDLLPGPGDGAAGSAAVVLADIALFLGDDGSTGVELYAFPAALLEAAVADVFGAACAGTNGVPDIGYAGVPALGHPEFAVELANAIPSFPVLLLAAGTRADLVLGGGCTLYPNGPEIVLGAASTPSGDASVPVPIPATTSLIGAELVLHWAPFDPTGPVFGLASFSNGLAVRVGRS